MITFLTSRMKTGSAARRHTISYYDALLLLSLNTPWRGASRTTPESHDASPSIVCAVDLWTSCRRDGESERESERSVLEVCTAH